MLIAHKYCLVCHYKHKLLFLFSDLNNLICSNPILQFIVIQQHSRFMHAITVYILTVLNSMQDHSQRILKYSALKTVCQTFLDTILFPVDFKVCMCATYEILNKSRCGHKQYKTMVSIKVKCYDVVVLSQH